ncbi:hypothetical protein ACJ5H2_13565 [Nocardioides sp. R1-1]|uniref:hypothetical protein n=1 Tax=Nocardioides sp. R1-1 TaxID=3383502 RepID=UPI0038D1AFD8
MARVYATSGQYATYTGGTAPANVDALLRIASRVVDVLLTAVVYDVDASGVPTNPDVTEAMADATCAIAAEADATGVLQAGGTQQWDSVGIGNVSLSGRGTTDETVTVDGIPVPGPALLALRTVGKVTVIQR